MDTVLEWFDNNQRCLPWRKTKTPYHVWLSEIILQQTRVEFGSAYYERLIERFPNVESLAKSEENEILKLWQGLGYYSRARNLHYAAKTIFFDLNNHFPNNFNDLKKLKGVGNYTAAAIASICFNESVPAVDGNAYRVYARLFNVDKDISKIKNQTYFFELGKRIISQHRPGDFNQAIMDIGSKICKPKNPNCDICPLQSKCLGLASKTHLKLPIKRKKLTIKKRNIHFLFICDGEYFLMLKNTKTGIWKNLFLFPYYEFSNQKDLIRKVNAEFNGILPVKIFQKRHQLTHQVLNIRFWTLSVKKEELKLIAKKYNFVPINSSLLAEHPIPKPIELFFENYFM